MLELPPSARDSGYQTAPQDDEGGWLFRRLTGQESAAEEGAAGAGTPAVEAGTRANPPPPDSHAAPAANAPQPVPADDDALVLSTSDVPVEKEETWGLLDLPERFVGLFKPKRDEDLARRLFQEGVAAYRQKDYVTAAA
ncbi:MAG: hypothetical protein GYA33_05285, partial [Thermogutta sp.]|nr:hypothetical protein [Thermogutta sp.]